MARRQLAYQSFLRSHAHWQSLARRAGLTACVWLGRKATRYIYTRFHSQFISAPPDSHPLHCIRTCTLSVWRHAAKWRIFHIWAFEITKSPYFNTASSYIMDLAETEDSRTTGPSMQIISRKPTGRDYCDCCGLGPSPSRFINPPNVKIEMMEYKDSAKRGCRACANIVDFLGAACAHIVDLFGAGEGQTIHLSFSPTGRFGTRPYIASYTTNYYGPKVEFFIVDHMSTDNAQKSSEKLCRHLDHPIIEILSKPSGDTSSAKAFSTLKQWLYLCETEHTICNSWRGKSLPHRVLEIQSLQPLCVRLVENCSRPERYACLSYRWGPQTKLTSLNTGNLDEYKAGIPEYKLYPLVKDAITAAHRLDLRYIWIDSYCIIQDDQRDWEIQAANMASIYEHAFLTLSATSSEDGCKMFSTATPEVIGKQVTTVGGEPVFIREVLGQPRGAMLSRAWVFQERLLSTRLVHFTGPEIFWECREKGWCECGSCTFLQKSSWKRGWIEFPKLLQNVEWEHIVNEYEGMELTFEKDRLPALAGVARRYGEWNRKTYVAGHWKEDIPGALMWSKTPYPRGRPLRQAAPTWSWASLPRRSIWHDPHPEVFATSVRLLGYNRGSPGADIYTSTESTDIIIEGPVVKISLYKRKKLESDGKDPDLIGQTENAFLPMKADFYMDPEDPTEYQAVSDRTSCLLLLFFDESNTDSYSLFGMLLQQKTHTDGERVVFERIGHFRTDDLLRSRLDESGEIADYCEGSLPSRESRAFPRVTLAWLLQRAEKRQITLV